VIGSNSILAYDNAELLKVVKSFTKYAQGVLISLSAREKFEEAKQLR
jgi:hypothetical protein